MDKLGVDDPAFPDVTRYCKSLLLPNRPCLKPHKGLEQASLTSQDPGCYLLAHLAMVPDSRYSEGQAQLLSQGHIGLASEGPSAGLPGFGDFEPSAVAGVVSLTSRVHGLPGGWPASCWGWEELGLLVWPLAWDSRARRERMEHREAGDLGPLPGMVQMPKRALWAACQQGQGLCRDLGLGLKVRISSTAWEILTIRQ